MEGNEAITTAGTSTELSIGLPDFFSALYGPEHGHRYLNIWTKQTKETHSFKLGNIASIIETIEDVRASGDVYFELFLQDAPPAPGKRGNADSKTVMTALTFDLDIGGPPFHAHDKLPATEEEASQFAQSFEASAILLTGHGFLLIHLLSEPFVMKTDADRARGKSILKAYQLYIIEEGRKKGWNLDFTGDLARLCRIPGTFNHKGGEPQEVRVIHWQPDLRYELAAFENLIEPEEPPAVEASAAPGMDAPSYPSALIDNIEEFCPWMYHCHEDAVTLTEPEWFGALSIIGRCEKAQDVAYEWSQPYPAYSFKETAEKMKNALKSGPRTCASIRAALGGEPYCKACPFWSEIKSPVQLGNPQGEKKIKAVRIVAQALKDSSVLFEEESLGVLSSLERSDKATFMKLRERLKRAHVAVKKLDAELKAYRANNSGEEVGLGQYLVQNGSMVFMKQTPFGEAPVVLTNFTAKICEEIVRDNGKEMTIHYRINGQLKNGANLPEVEISSGQFGSMAWVPYKWGSRAVIAAGQAAKDHLRAAVQLLSGTVPVRTVYAHTGWRLVGGTWVYLTACGGIGENGLLPHINVDLEGKLGDYAVPAVPDSCMIQKAIQSSMQLLSICPDRISIPLFAAVYLAPLCEAVLVDFSLFITGITGTKKSEISAIALAHFGKGFHGKNLPGNWISTGNALEKLAFLAKDAFLVIDDFLPKGTTSDVARMHQLAERVLRGAANKAGRDRMNADNAFRQTYLPRGLIVASGEDVPKGQSLRGRMLISEVKDGDVKLDVLTKMQGYAHEGVLTYALSGYLQWLAPKIESLKQALPKHKIELRDRALEKVSAHARTPDIVAGLMIGIESFVQYAVDSSAISPQEGAELSQRAWDVLVASDSVQKELQAVEDPAIRFFDLIIAAFTMGSAYLADNQGNAPAQNPDRWGWRSEVFGGVSVWKPRGAAVGWIIGQNVYLDPDGAYAVVQKLSSTQGSSIPLTQRALQKQLHERGFLAGVDKEALTVQKQIGGTRRRVLHILAQKFEERSGGLDNKEEAASPGGSADGDLPCPVTEFEEGSGGLSGKKEEVKPFTLFDGIDFSADPEGMEPFGDE
jgi:hypothetical protein